MKRIAFLLVLVAGCGIDKHPDLKSQDPYERALAVLDFSMDDPMPNERQDRLIQILRDGKEAPIVLDSAMIALSDSGATGYGPMLVKYLDHSIEQLRVRACITLGEMKDPETLPDLTRALRMDPAARVRRRAAYALAEFGPEFQALDALVDGLKETDVSVIYVSHQMLMKLTEREDIGRDPVKWKEVADSYDKP